MANVGSTDWMWKEEAGYYPESPQALRENPLLPDMRSLRDRRIARLFTRMGGLSTKSRVLELGCGRSMWLPWLGQSHGAEVIGIDLEPHAVDLAQANLAGARVKGIILCRDAFDLDDEEALEGAFDLVYSMGMMEHFDDPVPRLSVLGRYLAPGGRLLTTVPNMRSVNWLLQRLGDRRTLEAHVVYTAHRLQLAHEAAGFETIATGYVGFFDGYLTSSASSPSRRQKRLHAALCRSASLATTAWLRACRGLLAPEGSLWSPHVFYVGRLAGQETAAGARIGRASGSVTQSK
ncbi:MAG: class I SAM-dependent methyltransferase [Candidatus Polarisedimenticolia bacterium]